MTQLKEYIKKMQEGSIKFQKDAKKKRRNMSKDIKEMALKQDEKTAEIREGVKILRDELQNKTAKMAKSIQEVQRQIKKFMKDW